MAPNLKDNVNSGRNAISFVPDRNNKIECHCPFEVSVRQTTIILKTMDVL